MELAQLVQNRQYLTGIKLKGRTLMKIIHNKFHKHPHSSW